MKQQIDFFKSLPKRELQLPAKWITIATIVTLVIVTVISFWMAMYQIHQYLVVKEIHMQNVSVNAKFKQLAKRYPLLTSNPPLIVNIALLEKQIKEKKEYYATLSRTVLRHGFSDYLQTLARIVPDELWLREIIIDQEAKDFSLSGYTMKPVSVSLLLQALQNVPAFAGVKFNAFDVKKVPDKSYIEFKITNTASDLDKK